MSFKSSTNKTFDNYYKFKEYAYIKNIVKDSRVMSVGLDPMVAVMNDIKVIDGYHTIYPLSYKIKFRKNYVELLFCNFLKEARNDVKIKGTGHFFLFCGPPPTTLAYFLSAKIEILL